MTTRRTCVACAAALLAAAPAFADAFWDHWGDGKAEVSAYDLVYPRYGAPRSGTAVAVFVTETFAPALGVKSEDPHRPAAETVPVMKLNLIQDFPTGVYDYNLMTSAFVSLASAAGVEARRTLKVSFSAQEWCGQVYAQARFESAGIRLVSHSYFDGEADQSTTLPAKGGLAEDALLVWARGLADPVLAPGATAEVPLLRSLERARLEHVGVDWDPATLTRSKKIERVIVPAGTFEVETLAVSMAAERTWTFLVERAAPHRVVRFVRSDGMKAELIASKRIPYWTLNGPGRESTLRELGLTPRPPRTP